MCKLCKIILLSIYLFIKHIFNNRHDRNKFVYVNIICLLNKLLKMYHIDICVN